MALDKWGVMITLLPCFPGSFVNRNGEFIAHPRTNEYFNLGNCNSLLDVRCKILEQLSRGACKSQPYGKGYRNNQHHRFMTEGINRALGTDFSQEDLLLIYDRLGNGVNRELTVKFIESGYDLRLLEREGEE